MLDRETVASLRRHARDRDATPFMVLLAAFNALLYRYTGQSDVRVGVPVANRHRTEIEGLIGTFVNTLVVRMRVHGGLRFDELLGHVREAVLAAQAQQDLPFQKIVDALRSDRIIDQQTSLFQVTYNHLPPAAALTGEVSGLKLEPEPLAATTPQFELSLDTQETSEGEILASFEYAKNRFDEATIDRLADHWRRLLEHALRDGGAFLRDASLVSEAVTASLCDRERGFRDTWSLPVHELFARAVAMSPGAEAIVCGKERLSFTELDRRANRIANRLLRSSTRPNPIIAIVVDRSVAMFAGLLGILKAGGAFLPLDPALPSDRLRETMEDAGASLLVTESRLVRSLPPLASGLPTVSIDEECAPFASDEPPAVEVHPEHVAYVIYTSGSTGRPKGVEVSHRALAMHVLAMADFYEVTPEDTALQFASTSFDAAIEQWLVPLVRGARLVARGPELPSLEETYELLVAEKVTMVDLLPSFAAQLARWCEEQRRKLALRICVVGGEALSANVYAKLRHAFSTARIVNAYGPTETVVTPLARKTLPSDESEGATVAIGEPVGARTAHVLDDDLNHCPVGAPGHLYIGGVGLARGYHHRPGLTAERFVPDPWGERGSRLYRTGDRARYRAGGTIEFLGRFDEQVKVRGHRIELGEMEAHLMASEEVAEAVAALQGNVGEKRLVAYVVPRGSARPELAIRLRDELSRRLPAYMLPSFIAVCDEFPRTATGKIDRRALPEIERRDDRKIAPRSAAEIALASIWQSVLRLETVGVTDNFFELGGDSIVSLQVVSRAKQAGFVLTPKDVFQCPTIERLARAATPVAETGAVALPDSPPSGEVALTPIQAAFFEEEIPERHWYNQSVLLETRERVEREPLLLALQALIDHHDALRLRFAHRDGRLVQSYVGLEDVRARDALWSFDSVEPEGVSLLAEDAQRSLDL
ncbi:MAG: amino acid adenylation domain-containing protein, partial [Polyangiaceae bacterium]